MDFFVGVVFYFYWLKLSTETFLHIIKKLIKDKYNVRFNCLS